MPPFINNFDIQIEQYQKGSLKDNPIETFYQSFNEFFIRKFKDGQRSFTQKHDEMGAFAEARYFGHESMTDDLIIPVKGSWKHKSIGQLSLIDTGRESFAYRKSFLLSDWKLFHDALQAYRFDILHDVFPKYGI